MCSSNPRWPPRSYLQFKKFVLNTLRLPTKKSVVGTIEFTVALSGVNRVKPLQDGLSCCNEVSRVSLKLFSVTHGNCKSGARTCHHQYRTKQQHRLRCRPAVQPSRRDWQNGNGRWRKIERKRMMDDTRKQSAERTKESKIRQTKEQS